MGFAEIMASDSLYLQAEAQRAEYHTPSSRDSPEKVYATDEYSESPPRKSPSPESMKRFKAELEAEIEALSSHSSDPEEPEIFDPEGKTTKEVVAWVKEYKRANRLQMALPVERRRTGLAGTMRV